MLAVLKSMWEGQLDLITAGKLRIELDKMDKLPIHSALYHPGGKAKKFK